MAGTGKITRSNLWLGAIQRTIGLLMHHHSADSATSKPITTENVKEAVRILVRLWDDDIPPPSVVPRANGNIQLEWHTLKYHVEIYIEQPPKTVLWMENRDTGKTLYDGPLTLYEAGMMHLLANE